MSLSNTKTQWDLWCNCWGTSHPKCIIIQNFKLHLFLLIRHPPSGLPLHHAASSAPPQLSDSPACHARTQTSGRRTHIGLYWVSCDIPRSPAPACSTSPGMSSPGLPSPVAWGSPVSEGSLPVTRDSIENYTRVGFNASLSSISIISQNINLKLEESRYLQL